MRASIALCLLTFVAAPGVAREANPPARKLVVEKVRLVHQQPNDLIRLLKDPRPIAGCKGKSSLVPPGIRTVVGAPLDRLLLLKGTPESVALLKHAISVVDVPATTLKNGQVRVDLTLSRARLDGLWDHLRRLAIPDSWTLSRRGQQVVLESSAGWIRDALRLVMRMEMEVPPGVPVKTRPWNDEMVMGGIKLVHHEGAYIINLVAKETPSDTATSRPMERAIMPSGTSGVIALPREKQVFTAGTREAVELLRNGIRLVDVPRKKIAKDQESVVLAPQRVKPQELRESLLALPNGGAATVRDGSVVVEGSADWIHRALRQAMQAEMSAP